MDRTLERSTMRKVYLRLLPFAVLSYVLAYIDRINVSFAGLTMRGDLGMSAGTFGFAVGMFYWGYFIFEVPSNVILEKVGARIWIARIMITWGILAGITAVVPGATSFAIVRFLLGVAEAGFFPGIILYFTYWFPSHHHARIVSGFLVGLPVAVAIGAPISTGLLGLDGLFGLRGWQIMYIAEAIPTVAIGVVTFFVLTDRPEQAKFLTAEERNWLVATIAAERRATEAIRKFTMWQALYNPKVLLLALNYLGIVTASLGMLIFIPQMIKSLGNYSNMTVGWLTMIPYICGAIAMVVWGRISDRMNERRWNLFIGCVFSTVGLVIAGMTMGSWWALVGMSIAAMGFYGSKGPFFAMPPMFLSGAGLAAGIAWINSIGNLGGFFGPWYVGVMKDLTGNYSGGLYGLALLGLLAAIVCALFLHIPNRVPSSAVGAPAE
ncbi:MFS transporter [Bradyrhizobium canariense]|uniref:MFS transporter, ACS family, tartrate transporter n=1 Tax=Bradyrhizobium canariense TaxID=255045 RepID=A0A1H2BSF8_9BRAD|nr:MFS transporter [Bradyrhizobium canariense]SDT61054.1 MFS transporter, ACS family, tartrate transporter [Bradyrhizobium canariense]